MDVGKKTAKSRYEALTSKREPYLRRARDCAEMTIPSLMPPSGSENMDLPSPWQSVGAMGVNTLSNKVVMALIPPNTPFFKMEMDEATRDAVKQAGSDKLSEVEQIMQGLERVIMRDIEAKADRVQVYEAVRQLINSGNVLVYVPSNAPLRAYKLNQYVCQRDRSGNPLLIIIKEMVSYLALPTELAEAAKLDAEKNRRENGEVEIYTTIERMGRDNYRVWQEVCDKEVPNTTGVMTSKSMAYLPLRWSRIDGEDYGRGFIEEYLGDLQSLDGLQKAQVEGAAAAAKLVFLRKPSASVSAEQFASAENGDVLDGMPDDFKAVQAEKYADLRTSQDAIVRIEQRLSKAFLMVSSVQRSGDRVTAEEIRTMAGELEESLGGIYSTLTLEFQLPYVRRKIALMQMQGKLPQFPEGTVAPTIVTGLAALGRNHEVTKIMQFSAALAQVLGPQAVAQVLNGTALANKLGTGFGIQVAEIVKSQAQVQAEQAAAQRAQMMQQVAPELIRSKANQQAQQ